MESAFGWTNSAWTRVGSQSESSAEKTLKLRQPIRIEHGKNHSTSSANQNPVLRNPSRYPIRIEYYVTRVVITSPESSRLGVATLLGSRLLSARYSLSYYMRVARPPTTSAHTLTTVMFEWTELSKNCASLVHFWRLQRFSRYSLGLFLVSSSNSSCWYMPRFDDFMSAWTKICKNCSNIILFLTTSSFLIVS